MRQHFVLLYDRDSRILWFSPEPLPPWRREDVIGQLAADTILPADRPGCRAAFARLWHTGQPQSWDTSAANIGRWRVYLHRVEGFGRIAALGLSRPFQANVDRLTASERIICRLLAQGLASKQIGVKLGVARSTIDNRRAKIAQKLGITPHALVAWCGENVEWLS